LRMPMDLTEPEVRVLGCLIEKELTTPEYYPLTLNAVTNACNQKSSRWPVVEYDEKTVVRALDALRDRKLAWMVSSNVGRVPKYQQSFTKNLGLKPDEVAALGVLMLRGPQTVGEIRTRGERLFAFPSVEAAEATLEALSVRADGALVAKLPRQSGRKEHRFTHLLSGEPRVAEEETVPKSEASRVEVEAENARLARIEEELAQVKQELADLRTAFLDFRRQLE